MLLNFEDLERTLRDRLDTIGPAPRAQLLRVPKLPDRAHAETIGELHADPGTRSFAQLLIGIEEDPNTRAIVVGRMREDDRNSGGPS